MQPLGIDSTTQLGTPGQRGIFLQRVQMESGWAGWSDHVGVCEVACGAEVGREGGQAVAWAGSWFLQVGTFQLPLREVLELLNLHPACQVVGKV